MTLQNFGQPLLLVAACACKCRGGMTLQKSAFRWRHEAANWHACTEYLASSDYATAKGVCTSHGGTWDTCPAGKTGGCKYGPGGLGWIPIVGDFNADRVDTPGLYDPASGFFFLKNDSTAGPADLVFGYGPLGARPLIGDWDGQ